jgi:hypothetical protein
VLHSWPLALTSALAVRRHLLGEEAPGRVAVALGHVAQHLVVGAVLLDYVHHVADRGGVPNPLRDRVAREGASRGRGPAALSGRRPSRQGLLVGVAAGKPDEAQGAAVKVVHLLPFRAGPARLRSEPARAQHKQRGAVRGDADRRREPASGYETQGAAAAPLAHVEDGDAVRVGIRDVERPRVRGERQAVGRRPRQVLRGRRGREHLGDPPVPGIHHGHGVEPAVRDEQAAVRREDKLVRVQARGPAPDKAPIRGVDHRDRGFAPEAHVRPAGALVPGDVEGVAVGVELVAAQNVLWVNRGRRRRVGGPSLSPEPRRPGHRAGPQVDAHDPVVKRERSQGAGSVAGERDPCDDRPARGDGRAHVAPRRKAVAGDGEHVEHPVACTAADEGRPVRRKRDPAERLVDRGGCHHPGGRDVDQPHLVGPVARVQNGRQPARGVDRDGHREIPHGDLLADGADGPLVVQEHGPVRPQAGKDAAARVLARGWRRGGADRKGEEERPRLHGS